MYEFLDGLQKFYEIVAQVFGAMLSFVGVIAVFKLRQIRESTRSYVKNFNREYEKLAKNDEDPTRTVLRYQSDENRKKSIIERVAKENNRVKTFRLENEWVEYQAIRKREEQVKSCFAWVLFAITSGLVLGLIGLWLPRNICLSERIYLPECFFVRKDIPLTAFIVFWILLVVGTAWLIFRIATDLPDNKFNELRKKVRKEFENIVLNRMRELQARETEMNDETKLESLKYLSEAHRKEFQERRKYEWKITLTILTFYAVAVTSTINAVNRTLFVAHDGLVWFIFIFLSIVSVVFLWRIHSANHKNLSYAENSEREIVELLNSKRETLLNVFSISRSYWRTKRCIMFFTQTAIILIFAIAAALFVTAAHK